MSLLRKIIHIDMDAFYASVEQHDNPELKGKPVAVGGNQSRGVIAAASYEARAFGVKSAMPSKIATQKCRHLIFVKPRFARYKEISNQIREIFFEYSNLVEPLSLDEAYLDVTENKKGIALATEIAQEIRNKILDQTGLTASAGISYNKFLAKTASDVNKPNGMFLIHPLKAEAFVDELPIERFFGIGKATAAKMRKMDIEKGRDLRQISLQNLIKSFGKAGNYYFNICRAIDNREVKPDRKAKSVSVENTYSNDLENLNDLKAALRALIDSLEKRIKNKGFAFKTVVLKLRYNDFETISRNKSITNYTQDAENIENMAFELLNEFENLKKPVRLLGIGISNLLRPEDSETVQLTIDF
ncbi:MAG: DNA polymerase IV [Bacteroidia bacterium]